MHAADASQLAEMSMRRHAAVRNGYCGHAGVMSERPPAYADRRRAEAFGSAADDYDRYRPRYPQSLVAALVAGDGARTLDVGAGTGIASMQLMEAGAEVLAVEPDPRMAAVAAGKGIRVEQATFEDWQPAGRTFDLVVFAQSFHWVQPRRALKKVASILDPGGRQALLSNRVTPTSPTRQDLDEAYAGHLDVSQRQAIDAVHDDGLTAIVEGLGFTVERRRVVERVHYSTDDWVNMVFTHSNVLTLEPQARAELRSRLEKRIGAAGVDARKDGVAVICTPPAQPRGRLRGEAPEASA
jgi:SAM-dependent methyltransferase